MKAKKNERKAYEEPKVIYEGKITTRAGSTPGPSEGAGDPANLFGDD